MSPAWLKDFKAKTRIILSVGSLDTPVCDQETRRFNKEAAGLKDTHVIVVSMDLPFAQKRWCAAAGLINVTTLSDYRDQEFGKNYGTFVKESHLLSRAVFVVDAHDKLTYVEYVKEVASHPDYAAVLDHLKHHPAKV